MAAALVPRPVKRLHERLRTARYLHTVNRLNADLIAREGLEVRRGPFAGLRYPDTLVRDAGDLAPKLLGTYEAELEHVLRSWVAAGFQHVVDVGSAEGYYAVGVAFAIPGATVHAFDTDPAARDRCAELARHNGVAARVRIGGECTPETLADLPEGGVALLVDAEGYERELLDPRRAPRLRGWHLLAELHEFIDPGIARTLEARFLPTHEVNLIEGRSREDCQPPELAHLSARSRAVLLDENRPGHMRWMELRPR